MKRLLFLFITFHALSMYAQPSFLEQIERNNTVLSAFRKQLDAEKIANKTGIYPKNPEMEFHYLWGNQSVPGDRVDFSATQTFDFPTAYYYRKKISDTQNRQVDLKYLIERKNILLEAQSTYIRLIYQNALSLKWEERLDQARQTVSAYQFKMDKGDASALDLNKAKINLLNVQKEYDSSLAEEDFLRAELNRLNGGIPLDLPLDFPSIWLPVDFEQWYREQQEKNHLLQYLQQETALSRENGKLQRSLNLPGFSVGYMSEKVSTEQFRGITLGISIPLWENKNKAKQIKARTLAGEESESDARFRHYNEAKALYGKAVRLQKIVDEYRRSELPDNTSDLLKKALNAGEISLIDYLFEWDIYYEWISNRLESERDLRLTATELMQWEL
ncbi:MAG: TolC family protein [Dysgonamonadaceae bacterium]|jgi:outer membrane protein TolC|nr:TolC family protein [Dysgonamonadaceae bacterium]